MTTIAYNHKEKEIAQKKQATRTLRKTAFIGQMFGAQEKLLRYTLEIITHADI